MKIWVSKIEIKKCQTSKNLIILMIIIGMIICKGKINVIYTRRILNPTVNCSFVVTFIKICNAVDMFRIASMPVCNAECALGTVYKETNVDSI